MWPCSNRASEKEKRIYRSVPASSDDLPSEKVDPDLPAPEEAVETELGGYLK
jgi:hypothetical protein